MKLLSLFFLLLFPCLLSSQEIYIRGKVIDSANNSLPYANVLLLNNDSSFVSGVATNKTGSFKLIVNEKKKYILKIKILGYKDFSKVLSVKSSIDIGYIKLEDISYDLGGVHIIGKSPIIKREADRIIFDARSVSGITNVVDLLNFTPGIIVNGDDISMFSTQGVRFYINGKEQKLSSKEMMQVLKSYPASDVDKIELITNPSARFAADGKAGIINLKLKKKQKDYIGGSVSYARTQYEEEADNVMASVIFNKKKLSSSVNVGANIEDNPYIESNIQQLEKLVKRTTDNGLIGNKNYFFKYQLDYALTDRLSIGTYALYNNGKRNLNIKGLSYINNILSNIENEQESILDRNERTKTFALNANAEQKVGSKGAVIWYNFDYYRQGLDDNSFSNSCLYQLKHDEEKHNSSYINLLGLTVNNISGKIDITIPWNSNRMNLGSHFSYTNNTRDLSFENSILPEKQWDKFEYNEYVWALYAEYQRKISNVLSLKSGVRMESTWTNGNSYATTDKFNNSHVRLFPSFFLGYNPHKYHSLNFSIINLVTRPNIHNVNPRPIQRNDYSISIGNPNLKPSYLYKANLGYTYKGVLTFDIFGLYQPNSMSKVLSIDDKMVRTMKWENCIDTYNYGINTFYFFNRIKWLNLILIQGLNWEKSKSSSSYTLSEKNNFKYVGVINAQVFFDSTRRFVGTISGNLTSKQKGVVTEIEPLYRIDLGLQYNCLKNKLKIGLLCRNIVASKIRGIEYANGALMKFNNKFQYFMPKLSITYNWGANLRSKRHEFESEKMKQRVVNDF